MGNLTHPPSNPGFDTLLGLLELLSDPVAFNAKIAELKQHIAASAKGRALADREAEVERQQAAIEEREAAVAERERAVTEREREVEEKFAELRALIS